MKLSNLLLTTSLVALTTLPASAQGRSFSSIDTDNDGTLSLSELEAVFGAGAAERILRRSDADGDGALTRREIRSSQDDEDDEDDDDEHNDESDDDEDNDESDENDESDDNDESDESSGSSDDENDDE